MGDHDKDLLKTKEVFRKCGTCSQTFGHLLNREFGHPKEQEEQALNPLAGGIMSEGHQCGMLWGATLSLGAESYRRHGDIEQSIAVAVVATQHIIASFLSETGTVNCREITGYKLNSVFGMVQYMIKTMLVGMNNSPCFNLAENWAPKAIRSGSEGLLDDKINLTQKPMSCATEVVKHMGGADEEMAMVAGFAGGLGLSGNACGALSAAIWMKTLIWCRDNPGKTAPLYKNAGAKAILKKFMEVTNSSMLCSEIAGQRFDTINDHSDYISHGGCSDLIEALAET